MTPTALVMTLLAAAAVAAMATPIVGRLAQTFGVIDKPNERKVNLRANIPLLGGVAVALGFFVGVAVALLLTGDELPYRNHIEGHLLGALLILTLGAVDDRYALSARWKLCVQLVAAALAILYGFRIDHITDPVTRNSWYLPEVVVWLATMLWIVAITNAMNLMDGLDGLTAGLGAIIGITLTWVCWQASQPVGVMVGLAFVGALLGFLPFNFPPARIFLGDTGALFIGFNLSLLAIEGYQKRAVLTLVVPLLALAVPLMDTALSIYRRLRRRTNIMSADRAHMHHRLLDSEGSHRAAVLSLYFLTGCFCVIAVSFTNLEGTAALLFLGLVLILTLRLLRNLGFFDVGEQPGMSRSEEEGN